MQNKLITIIASLLLLNSTISQKMLIVIDYQYDFLIDGALGKPYTEPNSLRQLQTTKQIESLLGLFKNDPVIYSGDYHPAGHVSFLSTHLEEQKENEEAMEYLTNGEVPLKMVQLVYDKSTVTDEHDQNSYEIVDKIYGGERAINDETEVSYVQELWPDHCVQSDVGKPDGGVNVLKEIQGLINDLPNQEHVHYISKGTNVSVDSYSIVRNNLKVVFSNVVELIKEYEVKEVYLVGVAFDFCVLNSARDIAEMLQDEEDFETIVIKDATLSIADSADDVTAKKYEKAGVTIMNTSAVFEKVSAMEMRRRII
jgi:nicotinamidase-related amidase